MRILLYIIAISYFVTGSVAMAMPCCMLKQDKKDVAMEMPCHKAAQEKSSVTPDTSSKQDTAANNVCDKCGCQDVFKITMAAPFIPGQSQPVSTGVSLPIAWLLTDSQFSIFYPPRTFS